MRTIDTEPAVTLRLEGELRGLEVAELHRVASELLNQGRALRLDLERLTYADTEGAATLRALNVRGAELRNASSFVLLMVEGG